MAPEMAAVERTGGYDLKVCWIFMLVVANDCWI